MRAAFRSSLPTFPVLLAVAGCAGGDRPAAPIAVAAAPEEASDWPAALRDDDRERIAGIDRLWARALEPARRTAARRVAGESGLLDPAAGLPHPALPPGAYRCRAVKIGAPGPGRPAFRAYPPFFCHVGAGDSGRLSFTKQTGSDRPAGWLHPDGDRRYLFLGTATIDGPPGAVGYGERPAQNLVGIVERIGDMRWRLVLAGRGDSAQLDVYELVPLPPVARDAE